jgi:hypothetical protein
MTVPQLWQAEERAEAGVLAATPPSKRRLETTLCASRRLNVVKRVILIPGNKRRQDVSVICPGLADPFLTRFKRKQL